MQPGLTRAAPSNPGRHSVRSLLSDIGIQRELGTLPGWTRRGVALMKTFQSASFPEAIAFVSRVADAAEARNHHPDIDIRYTKVTFTLSTHDSGGITELDVALARDIEQQFHEGNGGARPSA